MIKQTVIRLVPRRLRAPLRSAQALYRSVEHRVGVQLGWRDPLIPPDSLPSVGSIGSPDFVAVGEEFFRYFVDLCDLKPHHRVLDFGSGTARMARPLTRYLKDGSYEGVDIVASSIKWCQESYRRYHNFHFHFVDICNTEYNPKGKYKPSEYRFPFETSSFDFVFLTSVFTHMVREDMENYLSEVARVLKGNGRCLITYFLLNSDSWKLIHGGTSNYSFRYELPGCRVEYKDKPEAVVGYDEATIRGLYPKHQLNISEPILYGRWCSREGALSWQDMVLARKPE